MDDLHTSAPADDAADRIGILLDLDGPILCRALDMAHKDGVAPSALCFVVIDHTKLRPSLLMGLLETPHYRARSEDDERLLVVLPRLTASSVLRTMVADDGSPMSEALLADIESTEAPSKVRLVFIDFNRTVWGVIPESDVRACDDASPSLFSTVHRVVEA